jgi:hypothetical protein
MTRRSPRRSVRSLTLHEAPTPVRVPTRVVIAAVFALAWLASAAQPPLEAQGCIPIVCENQLPGSPESEWDVSGAGDPSIQGFATDISVNRGQTIEFKVATNAADYRLDIYRMGYYAGMGARKVATINPSAQLPQVQPACLTDESTGLVDCGNWGVSASWAVPSTAVSGIYFAKVIRSNNGGASHIRLHRAGRHGTRPGRPTTGTGAAASISIRRHLWGALTR